MAYNFLRSDRDQPFLLPPDLRDWLPQGHLAWFILDVVDQLDLVPFYQAHRDDGHGRPAYDPKLLLCAAAGMVKVGMVALDGTKLAGNAADKANRTHERLQAEVAEILRQAAEADQREDLEHG